MLQNTLDTIKP